MDGFAATAFGGADFDAADFDVPDFAAAVLGAGDFAFADGTLVGVAFASVRCVAEGVGRTGRSAADTPPGAEVSAGAFAISDRVERDAGADGGRMSAAGGDSATDVGSTGGSAGALSAAAAESCCAPSVATA